MKLRISPVAGLLSALFLAALLFLRAIDHGLPVVQAATGFTQGNLVVDRVGDGSMPLSSNATAVFLDEYTPTGALVQSIPLPTSVSGTNKRMTASGSATSEGELGRSVDGKYLTAAGYDAAAGTACLPRAEGNGNVLILFGGNLATIEGAAQLVTDETTMAKLYSRLGVGLSGRLPYFDVLLEKPPTAQKFEVIAHRIISPNTTQ